MHLHGHQRSCCRFSVRYQDLILDAAATQYTTRLARCLLGADDEGYPPEKVHRVLSKWDANIGLFKISMAHIAAYQYVRVQFGFILYSLAKTQTCS